MSPLASGVDVRIRPYRTEDEDRVLALLDASLGGGPAGTRSPEFFRWKHVDNPFGTSFMLVAEADGTIVGLRAFLRWRLWTGDRDVPAVRAVDTATHPRYQGMGIFSRLTRSALEELGDEVELVFNTPNDKSLPGYLKMGWELAGRVSISVRVHRPVRFAARVRGWRDPVGDPGPRPAVDAEPAGDVLDRSPDIRLMLEESDSHGPSLVTPRDLTYLRWRYGAAPRLDYRIIRDESGGSLRGLAIFRVRPRGRLWETTVAEVIVPPGDHATAGRLLRAIVRSAPVDHLTAHFSPAWGAAAAVRRNGFLRLRGGVMLAVRAKADLRPDPTELRNWDLSLGDVEVF